MLIVGIIVCGRITGVFQIDQENSLDIETITDFVVIEEILKSKILNKK